MRELREKVDDDCVILPRWMFEVLKIRENDPVSISLNTNLKDKKFFDATEVGLIPMDEGFKYI